MSRERRKRCSRCRKLKCLDEFHAQSSRADGRQAYCKPCHAVSSREAILSTRFGLTTEEYDRILASQNGTCAICAEPNSIDRRLAVDHNHETGVVRGILCHACNLGLGFFRDSPERMHSAIEYLKRAYAEATNEG